MNVKLIKSRVVIDGVIRDKGWKGVVAPGLGKRLVQRGLAVEVAAVESQDGANELFHDFSGVERASWPIPAEAEPSVEPEPEAPAGPILQPEAESQNKKAKGGK